MVGVMVWGWCHTWYECMNEWWSFNSWPLWLSDHNYTTAYRTGFLKHTRRTQLPKKSHTGQQERPNSIIQKGLMDHTLNDHLIIIWRDTSVDLNFFVATAIIPSFSTWSGWCAPVYARNAQTLATRPRLWRDARAYTHYSTRISEKARERGKYLQR